MRKVKLRLPSGNLAVYAVEDRFVAPEDIRMYGKHLATQFGGRWYRVAFNMIRDRLYDADLQEVLDLPISFEAPHPMWGLQVYVRTRETPFSELVGNWLWVRGSDGPYEYHTEEEASQMLAMCYPEAILGTEVRTKIR